MTHRSPIHCLSTGRADQSEWVLYGVGVTESCVGGDGCKGMVWMGCGGGATIRQDQKDSIGSKFRCGHVPEPFRS